MATKSSPVPARRKPKPSWPRGHGSHFSSSTGCCRAKAESNSVISGNIGLAQLEAPNNNGNLLSFLAKAGQASQHAARLSSQLLTFSKGGAPLKKVPSVAELIQHAAEFSLHGSNLRSTIGIEDHLGKAEIDVAQVEQVLNALIINARGDADGRQRSSQRGKHPGQRKIGLPLESGRYIKIAVAYHGAGVAPELAAKIFDPYFTIKEASSGLGLAISYSIIRKHGGFLHLENNSPAGATFAFYLPAARGKVVSDPLRPNDRSLQLNHQRILVMDDESAIRELTAQLLGTMGYEVTAVPDGSEAVCIYERAARKGEHFRAVILDATVRAALEEWKRSRACARSIRT